MMSMSQQELLDAWKLDSVINIEDLTYEAIKSSTLHAKYLEQFVLYKARLLRYEIKYLTMKKLRTRYYRGELTQDELIENDWPQYQGPKLPKTETETFLSGDEILTQTRIIMEDCKNTIAALEHIIKQIYNRSYEIKNSITDRQFKMGY